VFVILFCQDKKTRADTQSDVFNQSFFRVTDVMRSTVTSEWWPNRFLYPFRLFFLNTWIFSVCRSASDGLPEHDRATQNLRHLLDRSRHHSDIGIEQGPGCDQLPIKATN
jgi:hypothetical protein